MKTTSREGTEVIVPKSLWNEMSVIISSVKASPVRHAGTSCYAPSLFDKERIDRVCESIKRCNHGNH